MGLVALIAAVSLITATLILALFETHRSASMNRWTLWLVRAACGLPIVASAWMLFGVAMWIARGP
ncbi:MAG: hypothetical protein HY816_19895 [Candidatus Wallbacteria bacterium]|nr:hypothetical protein [Candidatus Wallbacteria bacterium]